MSVTKLNSDQIQSILKIYSTGTIPATTLASEFGVTSRCIYNILKKHKIPRFGRHHFKTRRFSLDENYFDKIDTESKAYFLGLLYADGYNNEETGTIEIALSEVDKHILQSFQKELKSSRPLGKQNKKKYGTNNQNAFRLRIDSDQISKALTFLGCVQRKSLILEFPTLEQVPKKYVHHFIRGIMDGDGHISCVEKDNGNFCVKTGLVSTRNFCEALGKMLFNELGINAKLEWANDNGITSRLTLTSYISIITFLNWIYQDSRIYLKRKYKKYKQIKRQFEIAKDRGAPRLKLHL